MYIHLSLSIYIYIHLSLYNIYIYIHICIYIYVCITSAKRRRSPGSSLSNLLMSYIFACRGNIIYSPRVVRVILAQGPYYSFLHGSNFNG